MASRWLKRPEVYSLFAAMGVAAGTCGMKLVTNICINPDLRLLKENRAAGVVDNFEEGEREQGPRKFISHRPPEIFPSVHNFFCRPDLP
ncbi:NADH-ubiquinone reductase complex 1 MLRQ subunit [Melia azedarach]|uniref:NADH-ubiquinone reductase complex 1 MLRQ subunit n=1 Tax=Melia azedarach TaxID=155640 RepID=A0ACC1XIV7_MELAZ|nr:NADH-ubiquinone reductase complex 1 MLRQ subunit [Melia azedarach]